ncbi:hypothetical protein EUGRSUZ_K02117 [Eucalyptus grandis]|uniref:Uncharacterized protein n=2 Tax=Eucalyptus grandis TaxID=71139 RepID=A0ACC3IVB8_EUCGR|nr:hypothetical protein EUGRSUZ_K02117 [Eucalyptus grandis]
MKYEHQTLQKKKKKKKRLSPLGHDGPERHRPVILPLLGAFARPARIYSGLGTAAQKISHQEPCPFSLTVLPPLGSPASATELGDLKARPALRDVLPPLFSSLCVGRCATAAAVGSFHVSLHQKIHVHAHALILDSLGLEISFCRIAFPCPEKWLIRAMRANP